MKSEITRPGILWRIGTAVKDRGEQMAQNTRLWSFKWRMANWVQYFGYRIRGDW